jgi:Fur family zinc uptake transcriptional regulator
MSPGEKGDIEALLDKANKALAAKGAHLTPLRRRILAQLLSAPGPVRAYDLIEAASQPGNRLAPATVYRILDFFLENGLVHKVSSLNAFVACDCQPEAEHRPVILVCPDCRNTTEINDDHLASSLYKRLDELGYPLKDGSIEVTGTCGKCHNTGDQDSEKKPEDN